MPRISNTEMSRLQPKIKPSSKPMVVILPHTCIHKDTLGAILSRTRGNSAMRYSLCRLSTSSAHYISAELLFGTLSNTSNNNAPLFHHTNTSARCERLFTHGQCDTEEKNSLTGPQTTSDDQMMLMIRQAYIKQQISVSSSRCPKQCIIL